MRQAHNKKSVIESALDTFCCPLFGVVQVALILLVANIAFAQQTNGLDEFQFMYQEATMKLEASQVDAYRKLLRDAAASAKEKGDLDGYLVVDLERNRFNRENKVPMTNVLPEVYSKPFEKMVKDYEASNVSLHRRYVSALDGLVKRLMIEDRIDDAKAARAEKEKALFLLSLFGPVAPMSGVAATKSTGVGGEGT